MKGLIAKKENTIPDFAFLLRVIQSYPKSTNDHLFGIGIQYQQNVGIQVLHRKNQTKNIHHNCFHAYLLPVGFVLRKLVYHTGMFLHLKIITLMKFVTSSVVKWTKNFNEFMYLFNQNS